MTTEALKIHRGSRVDWFARSGFPLDDMLQVGDPRGPRLYAQRLCKYITNPSTVRVRVLERFGEAPTLDLIRAYRSNWLEEVQARSSPFYLNRDDGLDDYDDDDWNHLTPTDEEIGRAAVADEAVVISLPPIRDRARKITFTEVIDACAESCGVSHGELIGSSRERIYVEPRNLCAAVLRARGNSLPNIGKYLGGRDHTTIRNCLKAFFARDIRTPEIEDAWMRHAPCVFKAVRTLDEFHLMCGVGGRR